MDQKQRTEIEERLVAERQRAVRAFERMDDEARSSAGDAGDLTSYPLHLADHGTDAIEKEKELLLLSTEGRRLYEIDAALRRLYRDPEQFGVCERCGRQIDFDRLAIVPWARHCVECKTLEENGF